MSQREPHHGAEAPSAPLQGRRGEGHVTGGHAHRSEAVGQGLPAETAHRVSGGVGAEQGVVDGGGEGLTGPRAEKTVRHGATSSWSIWKPMPNFSVPYFTQTPALRGNRIVSSGGPGGRPRGRSQERKFSRGKGAKRAPLRQKDRPTQKKPPESPRGAGFPEAEEQPPGDAVTASLALGKLPFASLPAFSLRKRRSGRDGTAGPP